MINDYERRHSLFVDNTKKLSELQQLIQNRNNSIVSANAQKMESYALAAKSDHNKTDQDVASTNMSSNLPPIGESTEMRQRAQHISIDIVDSEEEYYSDHISRKSKHSAASSGPKILIVKGNFTPGKREQDRLEKEEMERRIREEAEQAE